MRQWLHFSFGPHFRQATRELGTCNDRGFCIVIRFVKSARWSTDPRSIVKNPCISAKEVIPVSQQRGERESERELMFSDPLLHKGHTDGDFDKALN